MELATPLEMELQVFERHREEWSRTHPGKYVAIQDGTVLDGFFDKSGERNRCTSSHSMPALRLIGRDILKHWNIGFDGRAKCVTMTA
jgi:hypothetical protein